MIEIQIDKINAVVVIKKIDYSEKSTSIEGTTKYKDKTIFIYNSEWDGYYRTYNLNENDKIKIDVEIFKQIENNKIRFLGRANFQKYLKSELNENGLEIQNNGNEESLRNEDDAESPNENYEENESFYENENIEVEKINYTAKDSKYNINEKINAEVEIPKIKEKNNSAVITTHTIKSGDNLGKIAEKYRVKIDALRKANDIKDDQISIGQVLIIPN